MLEGELTHPTQTRRIFQWLHQDPQHERVLGSVDLTFDDPHCAEEKTAFLAAFAEQLSRLGCFPYDDTRGSPAFRADFAEYLRQYFSLPVGPQDLLVAPSRIDVLSNVLALYRPEVVLVDRDLLRSAPVELQQRPGCEILECPTRADLVCDLMQALRPQWVFTALSDFENVTPDSFLRLIDTAARTHTRLMVRFVGAAGSVQRSAQSRRVQVPGDPAPAGPRRADARLVAQPGLPRSRDLFRLGR